MRYLSSFRTSLKISRYLFRVLGFMIWALGALLTSFYLYNLFNTTKANISDEYNLDYNVANDFMRNMLASLRDIKYITEKYLSPGYEKEIIIAKKYNNPPFSYIPLNSNSNCELLRENSHHNLDSLDQLVSFWKNNIVAVTEINKTFFVDIQSMCMMYFSSNNTAVEPNVLRKSIYVNIRKLLSMKDQGGAQTVYWLLPNLKAKAESGWFYSFMPIIVNGKMIGAIGVEKPIRMDLLLKRKNMPMTVMLLNEHQQIELQYPAITDDKPAFTNSSLKLIEFGYDENFTSIVAVRRMVPSDVYIALSVPLRYVYESIRVDIIYSAVLNTLSAIFIIFFVWLFERRMFSPAEDNAVQLEEHEQFNHKIVASAPVGICILRVSDGVNILSNELAHNYIRMLSYDDQKRIIDIICDKTSSYIDVVTSNNNHLQISFVHSRYRNEEVAICVLIDVSTRVKMETSLQEMASAAEQANQAKSMFLATVSHELRTPLYGIIGNLELMQSHPLPPNSMRLLSTMNNSSSLLLKIISDILDFSKIESNQLKIEPKDFNCKEVISHVISNYLPLMTKKGLYLYCYIDPDIPDIIYNDPIRLQQIVSNLLNNAIKFTSSGCIIIEMTLRHGYLYTSIKDTGVGIEEKLQLQLFEPFFQISANKQFSSQGTGLGLAICEKLTNLMDGDIEFISQNNIGSIFSIRLPLYGVKFHEESIPEQRAQKKVLLAIRNGFLEKYLYHFLSQKQFQVALYNGEETDDVELLITNQSDELNIVAHHCIEISEKHIGPPIKIKENYWLYNTYELSELYGLLDNLLTEHNLLPAVPVSNQTAQADTRLSAVKVLVVDDHPINRHLLVEQLNAIGFTTSMVNDGFDAIEHLKNNSIDIILTDVNMPNMDGYELTQYLRNQGCTKPIIGITANALAEEKQRCTSAGMNSCLSKPVSLAVLKEELIQYINV
ncbi:two-component system sensor histidine kinase RcsC [Xenorhabdus sp. ZM]|uniref:two-component system sensor histidine kinase RcsC n=1 Tax=Xenorhabdus szentirmaii TaxID=290112 RepID=UPI0019864E44|nr:two-component system sensor histidine kinase RcsC [Xenorhabdus sp. ZM]MBD2804250.1 two-component system sensor histidine kinase RcsC [Xenorhabdus sp. ZM]